MIRLNRGIKPRVLVEKGEQWASEYIRRVKGDESVPSAALTRYADKEIKLAVMRDSSGKCIYCESKPRAVYPGAVEHILPKAADKFPDKVVEWSNLGFVCFECNRCKSDYWHPDLPILDPYVDEPADHLLFFGPLVLSRSESGRGKVTVHRLELDRRTDLIDRKSEHIRKVNSLIRGWRAEVEGPLKTVLEDEIRRFAEADEEYAATTRVLLDLEGFPR